MLLRLLKYILFAGLLVPSFALAANTHHYDCSGADTPNGATTCSGADYVFSSTSKGGFGYIPGTSFNLGGTTSWYISYTATGVGTTGDYGCTDGVTSANCFGTLLVGTNLDVPFDTSFYGATSNGLFMDNGGTNGVSTNFVGTLSNVCISDTSGACEGGGGGGTGTTTASTTITIIDNPTQDLFDAVFLFFISMFFIVWFFMNRFRLV